MGKKNRTKQIETGVKRKIVLNDYLVLLYDLSYSINDEFVKQNSHTHISSTDENEQYFSGGFTQYMGSPNRNNYYYTVISKGKIQVYYSDHKKDLTKEQICGILKIITEFSKKHGLEVIEEG